jgi:hypothetical protein
LILCTRITFGIIGIGEKKKMQDGENTINMNTITDGTNQLISSYIDEDGVSWALIDDDAWARAEFTTVTNSIRHPKGH